VIKKLLWMGMPALAELAGPDAQVSECLALGLGFIELNMNLPEYIPSRLEPLRLRELSREHGIGFTLHGPEELDLPATLGFARKRGCSVVLEVKTREGLEESVRYVRALL
jgi:hypothetical protein